MPREIYKYRGIYINTAEDIYVIYNVNYYYAESEHCVNNNEWQNACGI